MAGRGPPREGGRFAVYVYVLAKARVNKDVAARVAPRIKYVVHCPLARLARGKYRLHWSEVLWSLVVRHGRARMVQSEAIDFPSFSIA